MLEVENQSTMCSDASAIVQDTSKIDKTDLTFQVLGEFGEGLRVGMSKNVMEVSCIVWGHKSKLYHGFSKCLLGPLGLSKYNYRPRRSAILRTTGTSEIARQGSVVSILIPRPEGNRGRDKLTHLEKRRTPDLREQIAVLA